MDDLEIITYEYIHEIVDRFAKDLIERRITFDGMSENETDPSDKQIDFYAKVGEQVQDYFLHDVRGEQRVKLEKDLFDNIVILNTGSMVIDKELKQSIIEEKIEKLEKKLESTNRLLVDTLKTLKVMGEKIDKL